MCVCVVSRGVTFPVRDIINPREREVKSRGRHSFSFIAWHTLRQRRGRLASRWAADGPDGVRKTRTCTPPPPHPTHSEAGEMQEKPPCGNPRRRFWWDSFIYVSTCSCGFSKRVNDSLHCSVCAVALP